MISATTGESLVEIRSTSGEAIKVIASEKNLGAYVALSQGGINGDEFENATGAVSQDSGVFAAIFGLIDNDWKLMISDWVTDDREDTSPLKDGETVTGLAAGD